MEKNMIMYWLANFQLAKEGDKEAQAEIALEDERRKEKGLPSLKEELLAIAERQG